MREKGKVIKILDNGCALVEMERQEGCKHCNLCRISKESSKLEVEISIPESIQLNQGDKVVIEISGKNFLQISFLAYGLPVLIFIAGYFIGDMINNFLSINSQLVGVFSAFILIICYFMILARIMKNNKSKNSITIVEKINETI